MLFKVIASGVFAAVPLDLAGDTVLVGAEAVKAAGVEGKLPVDAPPERVLGVFAFAPTGGYALKVEGIEEIYVKILSQIGKPINEPKAVDVQIIPKDGYDVERMERGIFEIVEGWLDNVTKVTKMIVNGDVDIF